MGRTGDILTEGSRVGAGEDGGPGMLLFVDHGRRPMMFVSGGNPAVPLAGATVSFGSTFVFDIPGDVAGGAFAGIFAGLSEGLGFGFDYSKMRLPQGLDAGAWPEGEDLVRLVPGGGGSVNLLFDRVDSAVAWLLERGFEGAPSGGFGEDLEGAMGALRARREGRAISCDAGHAARSGGPRGV